MHTIFVFITHSIPVIVVYECALQKVTILCVLYQHSTIIYRLNVLMSTLLKYYNIIWEILIIIYCNILQITFQYQAKSPTALSIGLLSYANVYLIKACSNTVLISSASTNWIFSFTSCGISARSLALSLGMITFVMPRR